MGTNKAYLILDGRYVINWVDETLDNIADQVAVVSNPPYDYSFLGRKVISDIYKSQGPLAGLHAVINLIEADNYIVSACDTPFISAQVYKDILRQKNGYDAAVPVFDGRFHPLSGIYSRKVFPHLENLLHEGNNSMKALLDTINTIYIYEYPGSSHEEQRRHFFNMNEQKDYELAKKMLKDRSK
ncbi:molybdopterin-guanine dinucleotide biosynthesis protein A [Thalassobacillus pellis]|nr:molybdopterin-guanine dinucleotide biosynthesis protein A [Thalassobacillus pellis]